MPIESHHLSILTSREIDDIFGLPHFTEEDRHLCFDLSLTERAALDAVRITSSAVHFVLQCGYFKAKRRFFVYKCEDVQQDDLRYIMQKYFPSRNPSTIKALSKPTRLKQQRIILRLFDYRLCDHAVKGVLQHKAQRLAMLSTQPIYIFREILQYLDQQRIVVPAYTFMQDLVGQTVTFERRRIAHLLDQALTPAIKQQLKTLLQ